MDSEGRSPGRLLRHAPGGRAHRVAAANPAAVVGTPAPSARDIEQVIGDCAVYCAGGRNPGRLPLASAVGAAADLDGFVWIGIQQPTAEEFAEIAQAFRLPPLAVEDAIRAHQRPKLEVYDGVVFVVLKPVRYVDSAEVIESAEIALFVGERFIVTVRHGDSDVLGAVRREMDAGSAGSDLFAHGPAGVLYRVADRVVDAYEEVVSAIDVDVDEIEAQVFSGEQADHAQRIYKLKREVLEFRRAVVPLAQPLQQLADGAVPGIHEALRPFFRDVQDHALRAADRIEGHDRMLSDVLAADLAQVSVLQNQTAVKQNEDMRKISAWAAIALVPTAIAGVYGMNFEYMPELTWRYGYFMVLGVIVSACVVLHRLFRHNGWL